MKHLALILGLLFSTGVFAKVTCDIKDSQDAFRCVRDAAYELFVEGELPHSIGVTKYRKGRRAFKQITGKYPYSKYIAVVQVHYDEDELLYYQIRKGKNETPKLIKKINLTEIETNGDEDEEALSLYSLGIDNIEDFHL